MLCEDGNPKVIDLTEKDEDITILIKNKYPIIYEALMNDDYVMEDNYPSFFHEIVYDNKIIGFYTYNEVKEYQDQICITEFYVIPEYRGNKIMINTLLDLTLTNQNFILYKPTRRVIEIFIENGLAWHFSKNMVRSIFKLSAELNDLLTNKKIQKYYYDIDYEMGMMNIFTNLFDTNTCSIVFNDPLGFIADENMICMSNPRQYDIQHYKLSKKLRNIDKKYIKNNHKNIVRNILKNDAKEAKIMEQISSNIKVEQIISEKEIDKYHKEHDIPVETLKEMVKDIQKAFDKKEINLEHIRTRFEFLVDQHLYPEEDEVYSGGCDYCGEVVFKNGICQVCGYNHYEKKLEEIKNQIRNQEDSSTGLYKSLLEKIRANNLDVNNVRDAQLEIAEVSFLKFLDDMRDYSFIHNFDDDYEISEEIYIKSLLEKKYIESTPNPHNDDEKAFLYKLKVDNQIPTLRSYKYHMHREYIYKINKKGRRYYKQNKCANLYLEYLHKLPYYEFKQYYNENITKLSKTELLKNYIKIEEEKAVENYDVDMYLDILVSKVEVSSDIYEKSVNLVQSIICSLNKYFSKKEPSITETPLTLENEVLIMENIDMLRQHNLDEIFNKAYDNILIPSLKHDKEDRYDDIGDILDTNDIININRDLSYKYLEM